MSDNRPGARQYVPTTTHNGYQLHSKSRVATKPEQIHLSGVKVESNENTEINSLTKDTRSTCKKPNTSVDDYTTMGEQAVLNKYSKSTGTKRPYSSNSYGILEPLNYSQQGPNNENNNKRARYDNEDYNTVRQADTSVKQRDLITEQGVMNDTSANSTDFNANNNSVKASTYVAQVQQTPLPAFNTCFPQQDDKNKDHKELYRPQKKNITRYTVEELTKSDAKVDTKPQPSMIIQGGPESKQSRKSSSRPFLPHPYWSPLKIEVPQFEPSPLKMSNFVGSNGQMLGGRESSGRYQMSSSPVSSDISPPSLPESPLLNGGDEELARRLSDSDRSEKDLMSDTPSPTAQEAFQDQDSSSDEASDNRTHRNSSNRRFWVKKKKVTGTNSQYHSHPLVAPELCTPKVDDKQTRSVGGPVSNMGLRVHDPYFWQNNVPNLPTDFTPKMSPFPASPLEQMRDYPYLALPHYLSYLSALEKGGMMLPFVHPMWRPTPEAFHPYIVNPALMDPRYMQYQAEKLKCESPLYKKAHLTPTTPTYKDPRDKMVTINEHIYSNERPISLESAASDRLSTISDDSAGTVDTVKSSSKINNHNNGNHVSSKSTAKHNCEWCGKSYSTFSGLAKHKQFHCSKQIVKQFNCQHCDKEYTSLGALKMHIRTHTLPCKCHICGKAFSRPWLLQGHIRTHTGEKPFSCQHCSRAFADRSNLRAHLQTHSDVKKYSCDQCHKTFSRMSLLIKHKETGCNVLTVV